MVFNHQMRVDMKGKCCDCLEKGEMFRLKWSMKILHRKRPGAGRLSSGIVIRMRHQGEPKQKGRNALGMC